MGYTYNFFDNQLIGVDELNKITKTLVKAGVTQESPEITSVEELNGFIANAIVSGGLLSGPNTQLQVSNNGNCTLKIAPGEAILPDGRIFTVDVKGTVISYTAGQINYVYVVSDLSKNEVYPVAYTTQQANGNYILLAEVAEDGTVTDKRTYAIGKVTNNYFSLTSPGRIIIENQLVTKNANVRTYEIPDNIKSLIIEAEEPGYSEWFYMHYDLENNRIITDCGTNYHGYYIVNAFKGSGSGNSYGRSATYSVDVNRTNGLLTLNFDMHNDYDWNCKLTFLT